jgi:NADPH:quinone reductase-like Zn-dependent oxidoreductase
MRAVTLIDHDSGPALREVPTPEPGPNELLVRVHASSINGFDVAVANGVLRGMMEYEFPVTLGSDYAGVVEQVGADVGGYSVGDEVFGFVRKPTLQEGTWADYVVVPEDMFVARKPKSYDVVAAGSLPLAGAAALALVDAVAPAPGDVILVVGASGGVGGYAVQLAAKRGARVIATGTSQDEQRLRDLGASETIDFTTEDVGAVVRERHAGGIQGLIDVANFGDAFAAMAEVVADGGRAASTLGAAEVESLAARNVAATNVMASPDPATLARLAGHADAGDITVSIDSVHSLEDTDAALGRFAAGKRGKIGIEIPKQRLTP